MEIIITEIREKLRKLSFTKQLTFLYAIARKLFPHYKSFSEKEKFGNPEILAEIYKSFEKLILQKYEILESAENLMEKLEENAHHTEDFGGTMIASFALDTCSFYYETLEYINDKEAEHIESLIELSIRPIETFLQNRNELPANMRVAEINNYMIKQPMILKELAYQLELLDYLFRVKNVTQKILEKIDYEPTDLELIPVEIEY